MTGFGKGESESDSYTLSVELKTVNNRFKDFRFKMGSIFNAQEIVLKKIIEKNFARGSFEIFVNYKKNATKKTEIDLDYNKIENFISAMKKTAEKTGAQISFAPTDFLKNEFYLEDEAKEDELITLLTKSFDQAISALTLSREEEGQKLIATLKSHADQYTTYFSKVKELRNSYQDKVKEKLVQRFERDANELSVDQPRFMQEVIYYLEKLDIDEEINRIQIHLEKLDKILSSKGEVGRQIDFLIQELNRETNTIGSKSGTSEISENVVQMKVQLEKIREQALNLQ
jgi:uncharacterized protein (TIGR00255 family)